MSWSFYLEKTFWNPIENSASDQFNSAAVDVRKSDSPICCLKSSIFCRIREILKLKQQCQILSRFGQRVCHSTVIIDVGLPVLT